MTPPRIEQANVATSPRILPSDVRPFVAIAMQAGQRQVAEGRGTAMVSGNDVVDLKGSPIGRLRNPAILTPTTGPLRDELAEPLAHGAFRAFFNDRRALACNSASMCPTFT